MNYQILAIENRIRLLSERGLYNLPIIHKLERKLRKLKASA